MICSSSDFKAYQYKYHPPRSYEKQAILSEDMIRYLYQWFFIVISKNCFYLPVWASGKKSMPRALSSYHFEYILKFPFKLLYIINKLRIKIIKVIYSYAFRCYLSVQEYTTYINYIKSWDEHRYYGFTVKGHKKILI